LESAETRLDPAKLAEDQWHKGSADSPLPAASRNQQRVSHINGSAARCRARKSAENKSQTEELGLHDQPGRTVGGAPSRTLPLGSEEPEERFLECGAPAPLSFRRNGGGVVINLDGI